MPSHLHLLTLATVTAVAASSAGPIPASAACPGDWVALEGGCYWWTTSAISGDQLSAACRAVHPDAVPVSVHSAQLNSALSQSLLHGFPGWLGLHRSDSGDQFTWADGSPLDFQLWEAGEPSGDGELCVYMNADPQAGTWAACDCQQWNLPYMCQL